MIIRLRGDLHGDLDWSLGRVPSTAEMMLVDGQWYRVTNVAWAVTTTGGKVVGWDLALVLMKSNAPPHLSKDEESATQPKGD